MSVKLNFGGMIDHSTIDYPRKVCAVIYLCGCCFRCPWCQNKSLVLEENCEKTSTETLLERLKKNFLIDAVCVTGGAPTMQAEGVIELGKGIKKLGLGFKIDTNGYYPQNLEKILPYCDWVSIDVKAPLEDEKYWKVTGTKLESIANRVRQSLRILEKSKVKVEARTTIVPGLIDSEEDIRKIAKQVKWASIFTLQQFRPENTLDPAFNKIGSPTEEEMQRLGNAAKKTGANTRIVTLLGGFKWVE